MNPNETDRVIRSLDVVLLTLRQGLLHVVLLGREPFRGALALPGGHIQAREDQSARDAAVRVLRDETGIASPYLQQLAPFSGPARDPRGWSVSIAHYALAPEDIRPADTPGVRVLPVNALPGLPFDHRDTDEPRPHCRGRPAAARRAGFRARPPAAGSWRARHRA